MTKMKNSFCIFKFTHLMYSFLFREVLIIKFEIRLRYEANKMSSSWIPDCIFFFVVVVLNRLALLCMKCTDRMLEKIMISLFPSGVHRAFFFSYCTHFLLNVSMFMVFENTSFFLYCCNILRWFISMNISWMRVDVGMRMGDIYINWEIVVDATNVRWW